MAHATASNDLECLKAAYPEQIPLISKNHITWKDGTDWRDGVIFWQYYNKSKQFFPIEIHFDAKNDTIQKKLDSPALIDQLEGVDYIPGKPNDLTTFFPKDDPGRIRYEPFFRKMYGNSPKEVEKKLVDIKWMSHIFHDSKGHALYYLPVTTVNGVNVKLKQISDELENLVKQNPQYKFFLKNPGGSYNWRFISHSNHLSLHSFGIAIDINEEHSDNWEVDLERKRRPIDEKEQLIYHNSIPWEIVLIFEKYGFIWGGKWHHYDTMHFEYRPEIFLCK